MNGDLDPRRLLNPTLADLRARLLDGMPEPGAELCFDLWEYEGDENDLFWDDELDCLGRPLPDCFLVTQEGCRQVLRGDFDHLPDSIPLQELFTIDSDDWEGP